MTLVSVPQYKLDVRYISLMCEESQILNNRAEDPLTAKPVGRGGHGEMFELIQWSEEQVVFNTTVSQSEDLFEVEDYRMQTYQTLSEIWKRLMSF